MGDTATVDAAPQHLRALEHANRVRLARADLKRKVAAEQIGVAEVILDCPWQAASMSISDLLISQRRWGRARCRRLLLSLGIPENKQIGTFTERQRLALAAVMCAKATATRPAMAAPREFERERHLELMGSSRSRAAGAAMAG